MLSSQNGHVEVVDKLLQHGATVDLQNQVIITPICILKSIMSDFSSSHGAHVEEYILSADE